MTSSSNSSYNTQNEEQSFNYICVNCKYLKSPKDFIGLKGQLVKRCQDCRNIKTNSDSKKCYSCNSWRLPDDFINKQNKTVTRCIKCRNFNNKQHNNPERIEKQKLYAQINQHSKKYKEKKRTLNEQEFVNHNTEISKVWRKKKKEQLLDSKINTLKIQAKLKGIKWNEDFTDEHVKELLLNKCFYCNALNNDKFVIDILNSKGLYEKNNCAACCNICINIKNNLDTTTFIKSCEHIVKFRETGIMINNNFRYSSNRLSFIDYKTNAININKKFELNEQTFLNICSNPCYYCNRPNTSTHTNGITCKDNNIGYIINNCVSCCDKCNNMKSELSDIKFIQKCRRITININK